MDPFLEPGRLPPVATSRNRCLTAPSTNHPRLFEDSVLDSVKRQLIMVTVTGCTPPIANQHEGPSPCCEALGAVGPSAALNLRGHLRPSLTHLPVSTGFHLETDSGASTAKT
jgi:hypothetical protein